MDKLKEIFQSSLSGKIGISVKVVDASIVIKWVIQEEYTEDALKLRDDFLDGKVEVHAPNILLLEIASALRKYCLKNFIKRDIADKVLELIVNSGIKLHEIDMDIALKSLKTSLDYNITVYDAVYIVIALKLNTVVYTTDDRLLNNEKLKELKIVKHIREY